MKLAARIILISLITYLLSFYSPWWILFVVTFVISFLIHGSYINTFITGFLGVGLVWLGLATYLDYKSASMFSEKIVQIFPIEKSNYLIIISGIIGGVCGGFGSLAGNSFKLLFVKKQTKGFYS